MPQLSNELRAIVIGTAAVVANPAHANFCNDVKSLLPSFRDYSKLSGEKLSEGVWLGLVPLEGASCTVDEVVEGEFFYNCTFAEFTDVHQGKLEYNKLRDELTACLKEGYVYFDEIESTLFELPQISKGVMHAQSEAGVIVGLSGFTKFTYAGTQSIEVPFYELRLTFQPPFF